MKNKKAQPIIEQAEPSNSLDIFIANFFTQSCGGIISIDIEWNLISQIDSNSLEVVG